MGLSLMNEPDSGPSSITEPITGNAPKNNLNNNNNNKERSENVNSVNLNETNNKGLSSAVLNNKQKSCPVVYGELVLLGYNGSLPNGEKGRRKSKYVLNRRSIANGIKKSKHYMVKQPQQTKAIQDKGQHSISYTLSRSQAVIVEYTSDENTDMFQIGRSSESPIDFVVIDTPAPDKNDQLQSHQLQQQQQQQQQLQYQQQSTISRFACRILIERNPPYTARIYAAGFDSSRNIFLGEKATKWQNNGDIDGLTTNGILIMHPRRPFAYDNCKCNDGEIEIVKSELDVQTSKIRDCVWREVSVCGSVYAIRETRSASQKGVKIESECNILEDGTLIDLCGATLLYRSANGLKCSPTKRQLDEMIDDINASRPQCPVGLNTLVIPRKAAPGLTISAEKQPYVYLKCGHVQGLHEWGQNKSNNYRTCPMCLSVGPVVKLLTGLEPSFYVDCCSPSYAFNPCGHMASERTIKFWSSIVIPHGTNGFHSMCPFCATPLNDYIKLIFQDNVD